MIVHAIADMHGHLPDIPQNNELLLIAGDIVPLHAQRSVQRSRDWLHGPFRRWLKVQNGQTVAVWGNHDFIGELYPEVVRDLELPWVLLQDNEAFLRVPGTDGHEGVRIYGSPWQPAFNDWAFNLSEAELRPIWDKIPSGLDILLLHGPPNRILDQAPDGYYCGSPSLTRRIQLVQPKVTVFGHIHNGRGSKTVDGLRFYNVTIVNEEYRPVYLPVQVWP